MVRPSLATVIFVLALFSASCASTPQGTSAEATNVEFSFTSLNPKTVRISQDGNVNWVNLAADSQGFVVFPTSIARAFTCDDLGPYFKKTTAGYISLGIASYEPNHVQLPCPLAPGSYDYSIWLTNTGLAEIDPSDGPQRKLEGTIVVEKTPPSTP